MTEALLITVAILFAAVAVVVSFSLGMVTAVRMMENMEKKYEKKSNSDTHRHNNK